MMNEEEAREVLDDVTAYLASRASLENEMLAGHTFIDICKAIKVLEQQTKTSYISVDLNKFAKEVAEKVLDEITYEGKTIREWAEIIVKQQPSEDCISRSELLRHQHIIYDDDEEGYNVVYVKDIKALPSVTPERPKGKWMECGGDEPWLKGYCCSLCNFTTTQKYDYCTCGAEMSGGGEDEVSD